MSRFADTRALREVDLGPCECPGAPHEHDTASIRAEYSSVETARLASLQGEDEVAEAFSEYVTAWNLLGPNGEPWPPSAESLKALKQPTLTAIAEAFSAAVLESSGLPNPSSAPSPASPRGSASPTRKRTPKPGT